MSETAKPRVYGFCDAGCRRETVLREDFLRSASLYEIYPDSGGKWHLEKKKQYKIFAPKDGNGAFSFELYVNHIIGKHYITTSTNDEYADWFVFRFLDYKHINGTQYKIVYEIEGNRYSEIIADGGDVIDGIVLSGATQVFLYNDDATVCARDGVDGKDGADGKDGEDGGGVTLDEVQKLVLIDETIAQTIIGTLLQGKDGTTHYSGEDYAELLSPTLDECNVEQPVVIQIPCRINDSVLLVEMHSINKGYISGTLCQVAFAGALYYENVLTEFAVTFVVDGTYGCLSISKRTEHSGGGASGTYYTIAIPAATDTDLKGWTATASGYELFIGDVAWMTYDLFIELKCENAAVFTEHNLTLYQDDGFLEFSLDSLPEKASTLYIVVPNYTDGGLLNGGDA